METNGHEFDFEEVEEYLWIYPLISTFYNFYRGHNNSYTLPESEKESFRVIHQKIENHFGKGYEKEYWEMTEEVKQMRKKGHHFEMIVPESTTFAPIHQSEDETQIFWSLNICVFQT